MEWLYFIVGFLVIIALAFFLGRLDHHKHPVWFNVGWIGAILILISMRFGFTESWQFCLLLVLEFLRLLEHTPSWIFYTGSVVLVGFICWYAFNLMGKCLIELTWELHDTRERIALMESSLTSKLNDISSRLPRDPE